MGQTADFGIKTNVDDAGIKALVEHLMKIVEMAPKIKTMFEGVSSTATTAFQKMSQSAVDADGKIVNSRATTTARVSDEIQKLVGKAEQARAREVASEESADGKIAAIQSKSKGRTIAELEEYLKLETKSKKEIIALQEQKAAEVKEIASKLTQSLDGEEKKRLKATQAELKSELAAVKEESEKRGIESKPKEGHKESGGMSMGLKEGLGLGLALEGVKALREKSKEADDAMDSLTQGLKMTGNASATNLKIAQDGATKMADDFAMSKESVMKLQGQIAALSGKSGEDLNKLTELSIGAASSLQMAPEQVAKMLTGATDPEIEKGLVKMGIVFDKNATAADRMRIIQEKLGPSIQATKDAANDGQGAFDRLANTLMSTVSDVANELLQAFKPALDSIIKLLGSPEDPKSLLGTLVPLISKLATGLAPVLSKVGEVIGVLLGPLGELIGPALGVLLPILTDLLVPVLTSLMPLIQVLAGILTSVLVPVVKTLGAVLKFVIDNGIVPLASWISGALTTAINAVIGTISKVTSAIGSIVSAVGSVLGVSDARAEERVKKTGAAVVAAEDETQKTLQAQRDKAADLAAKKRAAEEAKKAKEGQKADKDAYAIAKAQEDLQFEQEKVSLESQLAAKKITHEQFNSALEKAETAHVTNLSDIASKHNKGHEKDALAAQEALLKMQIAANDKLVAAEEKKNHEIAAAQHKADEQALKVAEEANKIANSIEKEKLNEEISNIKDANEKAIALENARYEEEQSARSAELGNLKMGKALAESLEANHQGKLKAIAEKGSADRRAILLKESQYLAGPIAAGFSGGFKTMMKGADEWTANMAQSNDVLTSIFGNITQAFIGMLESMIEKIIAMEAVLLVADLIPGFGAFMSSLDAIGSLIPGHAEGTDSSPGGWHKVGERGVELLNMTPGAQVIPNHHLPNLGAPPVDLSPLVSRLDSIHRATVQSNNTFAKRPAPVLAVNSEFRGKMNQNIKAEARRSA